MIKNEYQAHQYFYNHGLVVDYLERIGFPLIAFANIARLCALGADRHGACAWHDKPSEYHRQHSDEHRKHGVEPEEDSGMPNVVHVALRELMHCEALLQGYGKKTE